MTARMITEVALALAQDHQRLHPLAAQGGVLTPALVAPDSLVSRLERNAGFTISLNDL